MDNTNVANASFTTSSLMYLSNPFTEDHTVSWNGVEYLIPANKMTPVVVGTPEQNQEIRKLWAMKMCEKQLGKDKKFQKQIYTKIDLEPLMEKCLAPLEKTELASKVKPKTQREKERIANIESTFKTEQEITGVVANGSTPTSAAFN